MPHKEYQGEDQPIAFASKILMDAETRYANIKRELLAIVFACQKFSTYLLGRSFIAESDHKPLEMIAMKNPAYAPPRLLRMLLELQRYDVHHQVQTRTTVYQLVQQSWPHQQRHVPHLVRRYWDFRNELSTDDGLLLKGPRLIIPGELHEEYLQHLHKGHLSSNKV